LLREEERNRRRDLANDEADQARLHAAVAKYIGTNVDVDPSFSENASDKVKKILRERHELGRL